MSPESPTCFGERECPKLDSDSQKDSGWIPQLRLSGSPESVRLPAALWTGAAGGQPNLKPQQPLGLHGAGNGGGEGFGTRTAGLIRFFGAPEREGERDRQTVG